MAVLEDSAGDQANRSATRPNTRASTRSRATPNQQDPRSSPRHRVNLNSVRNARISGATMNMNAGDVTNHDGNRGHQTPQPDNGRSITKFLVVLLIAVLMVVAAYFLFNKGIADVYITNNQGSNIKSAGRDYNENR